MMFVGALVDGLKATKDASISHVDPFSIGRRMILPDIGLRGSGAGKI